MIYNERSNYFQWIGISRIKLMISIEPKLMSLEYLLKIASDKKSDTIYSMSSTAAA